MEDIEQIKKERDAAIEVGLRLADHLRATAPSGCLKQDERDAIAAIEALKPKPEPLECWVNVYSNTALSFCYKEDEAINLANGNDRVKRTAVHLREVTPAPEWERWRREEYGIWKGDYFIGDADTKSQAEIIQACHNAEMEKVTGTKGKH